MLRGYRFGGDRCRGDRLRGDRYGDLRRDRYGDDLIRAACSLGVRYASAGIVTGPVLDLILAACSLGVSRASAGIFIYYLNHH